MKENINHIDEDNDYVSKATTSASKEEKVY